MKFGFLEQRSYAISYFNINAFLAPTLLFFNRSNTNSLNVIPINMHYQERTSWFIGCGFVIINPQKNFLTHHAFKIIIKNDSASSKLFSIMMHSHVEKAPQL